MEKKKKKKTAGLPKAGKKSLSHPKGRAEASGQAGKKKEKTWVDHVSWFGD